MRYNEMNTRADFPFGGAHAVLLFLDEILAELSLRARDRRGGGSRSLLPRVRRAPRPIGALT